ncbi:MAG: AAA family ATPase, partial [Propionibacteriaceae bacterium]|nr:AAA family ATPase [Propionibacteriaceae bacterium]
MDRAALAEMTAWKSSARRKPLVLLGARQVGKTWLLKEFARREYDRAVYLSLDQSPVARSIFDQDLDVQRIVADIATLDGRGPIDPGHTLLILDEVQEAPRALTSLKYFAENAPQYHVACAGSLLGIASHQGTSFPVGKVNFIQVRPLTFAEFMDGIGETGLAGLLRDGDPTRFSPFHDTLVTHLRSFLFVGGMPEAVNEYAADRDFAAARAVHEELLAAYDQDFSKHAPVAEVPRLRAVFDSVPRQLARENKRFVYRQAQPGAGAARMEVAMQWLKGAGLVHQVNRVQVPRLPLAAYMDQA